MFRRKKRKAAQLGETKQEIVAQEIQVHVVFWPQLSTVGAVSCNVLIVGCLLPLFCAAGALMSG
jgi:hypothetical protein